MEEIIELVAVILGLSIPISVVWGIFRLKFKKLSMKQFLDEERQVLLELKSENAELKRRLEQLEQIIVLDNPQESTTLRLEEGEEDIAAKLEKLAKKQKIR